MFIIGGDLGPNPGISLGNCTVPKRSGREEYFLGRHRRACLGRPLLRKPSKNQLPTLRSHMMGLAAAATQAPNTRP